MTNGTRNLIFIPDQKNFFKVRNEFLQTLIRNIFLFSSAKDFTECPSGVRPNECVVRKKPTEIAPSAGIVHIKVNGTNRLENISMDGLLFRITDYSIV